MTHDVKKSNILTSTRGKGVNISVLFGFYGILNHFISKMHFLGTVINYRSKVVNKFEDLNTIGKNLKGTLYLFSLEIQVKIFIFSKAFYNCRLFMNFLYCI